MGVKGRMLRDLAEWCPPVLARAFGRPAALFFHGVEPEIADPRIQGNHHDARSFGAILRTLTRNFDVLPLAALDDVLKAPERHPRALFLMSDDGFANLASTAADMLAEEGLPWTLFVSTEHIDTGEWNPMTSARLFLHFAPNGRYSLPHLGEIVLGDDRKMLAAQALQRFKALAAPDAKQTVAAMLQALGEARLFELMERFSSERFLNWNEVRALAARGVTIGAHAHWHWPMNAAQLPGALREQARAPRARIVGEIGECRYFAYPFGNTEDVSTAAWQAVRDAGYDYGFTTLSGSLDGSSNPWLLPRYGLAPSEPNLAALVPLLRAGNGRLARWQARLAG
jgi:peptidoglycan/xylan/chitin deacetylase (PgdA/CDA1 family)